jgi:ferredoxin
MSPAVRMAREAALGTELGQTFLISGTPVEELLARAAAISAAYAPATAALGAYVGLVLAGGVAATMVRRARTTHAPHRALCLSCGRCFAACPKEQEVRRARQASRERRILSAMTAPGRSRAGA